MNISFDERPVLIISPHADDWFLGCLAVMYRAEKGLVYVMSGSGWKEEQTQVDAETLESWKRAKPSSGWDFIQMAYPARSLEDHRAEILDIIFNKITSMKPATLLLAGGCHQDHETVQREGWKAVSDPKLANDHRLCQREGIRASINARDLSILYYFPSLNDHTVNFEYRDPTVTLLLGDEVALMKHTVFEDVWKSQHHRREYCQLGDREMYALGRHLQ
jgi:hypothetical protein